MKLNNIALTALAVSAILSFSCTKVDDFLNEDPSKDKARPIETVDQLDAILASYCFYPVSFFEEKPDILYASDDYCIDPEIQKIKSGGYRNFILEYGLWNDVNATGNNYSTWNAEYKKAYYANLCLSYLDKVTGSDEAKARVKADASLMRAICYFQIALAHTLYYDGTNGDELGISLKNSISFEEDIHRASLEETWKFIDDDVQEALKIKEPFLSSDKPERNWRGSTAGARAFAARYYLYRGDFKKAEEYAKKVLDEYSDMKDFNKAEDMYYMSYTRTLTYLKNGVETTATLHYPFTWEQLVTYFEMEPNFRVLLGWKGLLYARAMQEPTSWAMPSQDLLDTYKKDVPNGELSNDLRYKFFMLPEYGLTSSVEKPLTEKSCIPAYINFLGDILSGPTTAEMDLIIAECEARDGKADEAMKYVNIVRKNRILKSVYTDLTASSPADALKKVLQERRREMPFTIRWYDMKRLNAYDPDNKITVKRPFYPYTSTNVLVGEPVKDYILEPGSRHYAIPLSTQEIDNAQGVIEQNKY